MLDGSGLGPVAELGADGYVAKRFVYGSHANVPDYVVTLTRTSTTTLESVAAVVHDRRGGVRELIAMSDSLSPVHTTYDEYGRISDPNPVNVGVAVPFGFAGGMFDPETGLVHLGAREYDPQTGRWLTPDPIGFAGGPNLYGYVLADPVNYIDPLGHGPEQNQKNEPVWGPEASRQVNYPVGDSHNGTKHPCWEFGYQMGARGAPVNITTLIVLLRESFQAAAWSAPIVVNITVGSFRTDYAESINTTFFNWANHGFGHTLMGSAPGDFNRPWTAFEIENVRWGLEGAVAGMSEGVEPPLDGVLYEYLAGPTSILILPF